MKKSKKGFTLAELLIVVAIIAVLVAVAIPIFTSQLEKSREATDLANVRSVYAEVMTAAITEDKEVEYNGEKIYHDGVYSAKIGLKQKQNDCYKQIGRRHQPPKFRKPHVGTQTVKEY